jgi:hypothetical protein
VGDHPAAPAEGTTTNAAPSAPTTNIDTKPPRRARKPAPPKPSAADTDRRERDEQSIKASVV